MFEKLLQNLHLGHSSTTDRKSAYRIKKDLGKGAFGVVREAEAKHTGLKVAIKSVIKKKVHKSESALNMMKREMSVLEGLDHPNVIKMIEHFETSDKYYLVFELATGGELFDRIAERGKFTERDAASLVYSILDGVAYLHDHDIVHRDLKPENILFRDPSPASDIVIVDFGISAIVHGEDVLQTMVGSPGYTAPEVIKKVGHGKPADLWSIGIITFTMSLCGYHPFHYCEDLGELMQAITTAHYEFESPYWDKISEDAKSFIRSLLALDPKQRPTAHKSKFHPWLIKYSINARENLRKYRAELQRKGREDDSDDDLPVTLEALPRESPSISTHASQEPTSPFPDTPLHNLADVWAPDRSRESPFNPKGTFKAAAIAVQGIQRIASVKKLPSSTPGSKDNSPGGSFDHVSSTSTPRKNSAM